MADATETELKDRCKSAIVAGGPCRWDPNASRATGDSCSSSCEFTTLCDDGGVDPPAPSPDNGDKKCADVACTDDNCPGSCCVKGPRGSCGGPKRLRQ